MDEFEDRVYSIMKDYFNNFFLGDLSDGDEISDIKERIERLEKLVKEKIEAPLVAAGKLPPPLPKRR
jgi:hypothetical protein